MTHCPQCSSKKLWKDGLRKLTDGSLVQRWLCRNCGYRFTDPNHKRHTQWKNTPFSLNLQNCLDHNCQGNNDPDRRDSTALAAVQTLVTVEKEEGEYAEQTIRDRCKILKIIMNRGSNLFDSESVKDVIAKQNSWSEGRKEFAVDAYTCFLRMLGKGWSPPRYRRIEELPSIPLESEIDQLIAGCSHKSEHFCNC